MEITEVRIKLVSPPGDKLRAFCSITLDDQFVVRDLKIIEGARGAFVAMPSRKLSARCSRCSGKNHFRARYCNDCGRRLPRSLDGVTGDSGGPDRGDGDRAKLHADVAHPINSACREMIQGRVLEVYEEELAKSRQPGYRPMELEVFDEDFFEHRPAGRDAAGEEEAAPAETDTAEPARGFYRREDAGWSSESAEADERERRGDGGRGDLVARDRAADASEDGDAAESSSAEDRRRRRFFAREPESEPEDNFGAGLFS